MIKNIIFDWSGVIKDSVEDQLFAVNEVFQQFGAKKISLEELKENWVQPYMLFYNKYLHNITIEQEGAFYKKAIMTRLARAYPGIVNLVKELKKKDVRMVVISSDFSDTVLSEIISFGLDSAFLDVITDVENKTAGMEELIKKHDFDKLETVVIGDSNHEIEAGQSIGIRTIATTWGFTLEKRLIATRPDYIVHNLDELRALWD